MELSNFSLPPDLEEFVSGQIASGAFATQGEIVREALMLLRDRQRLRELRLQDSRREVQLGLEQSARGESCEWDVEKMKAEVRKKFSSPDSQEQ